MNKAFELILERLEETDFNDIQMAVREVLLKYGFPYGSVVQDKVWDALDELSTNKYAKQIVQEVAEEYKECALCYLQSPCEYQNKDCRLPEEEYTDGWIPCSKRLPDAELEKAKKERGSDAVFPVLATINKKHTLTGKQYTTVNKAFYGCYNDKNFYNSCCDKLEVIAWQPLPEPFKEYKKATKINDELN